MTKLNPEPHLFVYPCNEIPDILRGTPRVVTIPPGYPYEGNCMILSNPMSQQDPWKGLQGAPDQTNLTEEEKVLGTKPKDGFLDTYGPLPSGDAVERRKWRDAHPAFIRPGLPKEYVDEYDTETLLTVALPESGWMRVREGRPSNEFGGADPKPFVNKFGGFVVFPDSEVRDFMVPLFTWLIDPDQVGASYQKAYARKYKKAPAPFWHPGVPDRFKGNPDEW